MTKGTEFDIKSWASSIECGTPARGELAERPDVEEAIKELLVLRSQGKTGFSIVQLHEMLQKEFDLKMGSADSLRTSIKKRMNSLYRKAF